MAKPATAQQLADLAQQQQADEAATLEEQTAKEADGGAGAGLAALITTALAAWILAFGTVTATGGGARLVTYLMRVRRDVDRVQSGLGRRASRVIEDALMDATAMGARHAEQFARQASGERLAASGSRDPSRPARGEGRRDLLARPTPGGAETAPLRGSRSRSDRHSRTGRNRTSDVAVPDMRVSQDTLEAARSVAGAVQEQLRLAGRLLSPRNVSSWRDVLTGLGAARRTVGMVRSAVAWCLHRAINDGATQTITALDARALWVTEPDACVICLAYAGQLADRDGRFPGGLSMDPASRSTTKAAIEGPPKHPNCRCRLVPWRDEWAHGSTALPELLRQQALRSVAAGRGRPSESRTARIRAARVLLARRQTPDHLRRAAQATAAGHF